MERKCTYYFFHLQIFSTIFLQHAQEIQNVTPTVPPTPVLSFLPIHTRVPFPSLRRTLSNRHSFQPPQTPITRESCISQTCLLYFSIYFYLNERKYDVGVLLSMGQSKASLAVQFALEILFIAFAAILLADVLLYFLAEDFIRSFMPMTVRLYYLMSFEAGISDLAMWSLLVLGIVVIVSLIPLIKTIRTKPRKLLM